LFIRYSFSRMPNEELKSTMLKTLLDLYDKYKSIYINIYTNPTIKSTTFAKDNQYYIVILLFP
ncbi:hypothetical protein, partial [Borrelia coriaceae]|uniref:hypothetical protein n=1 Tax=Borrelia coriaceae TaxID=144 RepID=UPI001B7F922E